MVRTSVLFTLLVLSVVPAYAGGQMKQSSLMMRRAGPSCRPGHLGAQRGAGYNFRLGPCAGARSAGPAGAR